MLSDEQSHLLKLMNAIESTWRLQATKPRKQRRQPSDDDKSDDRQVKRKAVTMCRWYPWRTQRLRPLRIDLPFRVTFVGHVSGNKNEYKDEKSVNNNEGSAVVQQNSRPPNESTGKYHQATSDC